MNLLRTITISGLVASIGLVGCGGGGGGSGDGSEPACRSYCGYGCQRAADCGYFLQASVRSCTDTCIVTTRDNLNSEAGCRGAEEVLRDATCAQLGRLLNVRMAEPKLQSSTDGEENTIENSRWAEHIGAELGLSLKDEPEKE
jgi:hypothetical protein